MRYAMLVGACMLALGAAFREEAVTVGVVDMGKALSKYEKRRDMEKLLLDRREKRQKEIEALAGEVEGLREEIEKLDPDSKGFVEKQELLIQKEALLETTSQQYEIELSRSEEKQYDALVDEIAGAAGELAKELGFSLVIQRALETPEGVWDSVLYADPRLDLTDRLIERLSERYKAAK